LIRCLWAICCIILITNLHATTWQVGPTRTYTMPSQVANLVSNGDVVEIDAGIYESDVAGWSAHNITLRGVGGIAHLKSNGNAYGQKAIWVIAGNNYLIEHIEFSLCSVPDMNGAGIRLEGQNLTLRYCHFHHNENGILTSASSTQNLTIEHCEFGYNGHGDGYSHNLYINHLDTFIFRFNHVHHANIGHEIKSRAKVNYILYNRISNEETGNASRCIDLPNGGLAIVIGNIIHQGIHATNNNVLGYGLEGLTNPAPHNLFVIHNTFYNQRSICNFFNLHQNTSLFKAYNNIFAGNGNFLLGSPPTSIDTASNIMHSDLQMFAFQNVTTYDFQLTTQSHSAIDQGTTPGHAGTFPLTPQFIYVHPCSMSTRCIHGAPDAGAYEYCGNISASKLTDQSKGSIFTIAPNPADQMLLLNWSLQANHEGHFSVFSLTGQQVLRVHVEPAQHQPVQLDVSTLNPGIYLIQYSSGETSAISRFVKQ